MIFFILYFDYLHVLLGLIVITTTRFEQFMNNHDLLLRPGQSSHHIHKMNIQKREIRKLKFKFLETRWIPSYRIHFATEADVIVM